MRLNPIAEALGMIYRDQAGEGGEGAGAGAGAGDGKGAGGAGEGKGEGAGAGEGKGAGAGDGKGAGGEGKKSVLAQAGEGGGDGKGGQETPEQKALAAAEKDARRPKHVPSKYWDAEKGVVRDEQAFKSLGELETRMRVIGLPPKTADEYKYEIPKEVAALGIETDPRVDAEFKKGALEQGLTQKQYEWMLGTWYKQLPHLADQVAQFSEESCQAELVKVYKTPEAATAATKRAYRAFSAYAKPEEMAMIDKIGNIPVVIQVLERIGKELGEDPGINPEAILDGESLATLMRGKEGDTDAPYWNPSDPRHKETKAKVMRHHEAAAAKARRQRA